MGPQTSITRKRPREHGGILIVTVLSMIVFIGVAALAIDIGYRHTTRNELQNVADAAALAGAGYLGSIYIDLPPSQHASYTFTRAEIVAVVQDAGQKMGIEILDSADDIKIGRWDWDPDHRTISPETLTGPDAVFVRTRRDNVANSPISTFFAQFFGIFTDSSAVESLDVTATATAALSGPSTAAEGELILPFALSENVFPNDCKDLIRFSPTTESCAGWHNFFDPINASNMAEKLIGFVEGDAECKFCGDTLLNGPDWLDANFNINKTPPPEVTPETDAGDYFEFQGGVIASLFNGNYLDDDYDGNTGTVLLNGKVDSNPKSPAAMVALFDYFRYRDGDGDDEIWSATIPIYDDTYPKGEGCMNPNTDLEILGFAKIKVISPNSAPANDISVLVECNMTVIEGRGGGGTYGNTLGSTPNLVQ